MSDIHIGIPYSSCGGLVDHSSGLAQDIGNLYLNSEYSDVVLLVAGQRFHAHRVILAARSNYFRAMMYGGLQESHQAEVEIKDANLTAFKVLLKYIYKGYIAVHNEKEETVHEILALSHQYGFEELEAAICDYLKEVLSITNFCTIYDLSLLYLLGDLRVVCEDFLDRNAHSIVCHSSFRMLSPAAVKSIIARDSFCAPEVDIFCGVREWANANETLLIKTELKEILALIRLPLISLLDLLNIVRPSQLVSPDTILDAIKAKNESRDMDLRYRGYLVAEENVATPAKDAVVLTGEMKSNLLDGNTSNYDMDRGFTRHSIDDSPQHILVKLGRPCIINHLRLVLWDKDPRSYSYYIEVSMDQKDWVRVLDHTRYHCRSWQYLYFPARAVRYIKVVGTNNTVNRVFHLVALEAYYTKQQVLLHHGLIVPTSNVALVSRSAVVTEGVSRSRNNLLNGDVTNYDWDSGYTCHQLGSGSICVQLGQPYWLGSLRLLLWDCDERSYSYYIHSSMDGRDWQVVVDRTRDSCRSWQLIEFSPRPVVYFKIVGVFNTANEVFHCVHFECPASTVECPISTDKLPSLTLTTATTATSSAGDAKATPTGDADTTRDNDTSGSQTTTGARVTNDAKSNAMEHAHRDHSPVDAVVGDGNSVSSCSSSYSCKVKSSAAGGVSVCDGNDYEHSKLNSPDRRDFSRKTEKRDSEDLRCEFDLMAESNRSPGLDALKRRSVFMSSKSSSSNHTKNKSAVCSETLRSSPVSHDEPPYESAKNITRDMMGHSTDARRNLCPVSEGGAFSSYHQSNLPSCNSSSSDHHPAGDGGLDYSSLGARPRRPGRSNSGGHSQDQNTPSYCNNYPGAPLSALHNFALNTSTSHSQCGMGWTSLQCGVTTHSSPTHSEYSFTRSSNSPTRSEYSNHSSRGNKCNSVMPGSGVAAPVGSTVEDMTAENSGDAADVEHNTVVGHEVDESDTAALLSSPDSPAYHRPPSPLLVEPCSPPAKKENVDGK